MILQREIPRVKQQLLALSTLVEERLRLAVKAVNTCDLELAARIIDGDTEIDLMEVDIEEECLKLLALHQPVAIDLRLIMAIFKMNNDLERIGDLAVNIAERGKYLASHPDAHVRFDLFDLPDMAQNVQDMLKKSIDALINFDSELARAICKLDDVVDDYHRRMYQHVADAIVKQPAQVESLLQYLSVSRYLERIADHVTNLAEDVIYLVDGDIIRHQHQFV